MFQTSLSSCFIRVSAPAVAASSPKMSSKTCEPTLASLFCFLVRDVGYFSLDALFLFLAGDVEHFSTRSPQNRCGNSVVARSEIKEAMSPHCSGFAMRSFPNRWRFQIVCWFSQSCNSVLSVKIVLKESQVLDSRLTAMARISEDATPPSTNSMRLPLLLPHLTPFYYQLVL